jgi:hypothetical protein
MSTNDAKPTSAPTSATFLGSLLTGAAFYTVLGLGAGIFYAYAASTIPNALLPVMGITSFLALWWVFILAASGPILFAILLYRATDPVLQLSLSAERSLLNKDR